MILPLLWSVSATRTAVLVAYPSEWSSTYPNFLR